MLRFLPAVFVILAAIQARAQDASVEEEADASVAEDTEAATDDIEEETVSEDGTSLEPPVVEPISNELRTSVSGSWRSEIFLTQKPRMRSLGGGRYGVRSDNVFPFHNTLTLRADEIGHPGLSIHFQGWAGLDLADVYFDQRFVADPNYLYLQFRDFGLDARAGRQMVFSGAARGLHLDGVNISYQTPFYLGFQALGGLVVSPKRGPDWYRGEVAESFDDFGGGFSNWEREGEFGDYAAGGRVFYRMAGVVSAGVSFVHVTRDDEIDHQLAGADLDVVPFKWMALSGDVLMAVQETALQEANVGLDFFPMDLFSFGVDYRHADPTLYISRMSIFSVFSNEQYDAVGGTLRFFFLKWLALHGGYHHHFYRFIEDNGDGSESDVSWEEASDNGYEVEAGVRASGMETGALAMLEIRRIKQDLSGINQIRIGGSIPIADTGLRAGVNAYVDVYDEAMHGEDMGLLGDVSLYWRREEWSVGGAFTAGLTPFANHELLGMVKAAYNFDWKFYERKQP